MLTPKNFFAWLDAKEQLARTDRIGDIARVIHADQIMPRSNFQAYRDLENYVRIAVTQAHDERYCNVWGGALEALRAAWSEFAKPEAHRNYTLR